MASSNPYERAARLEKATKLADRIQYMAPACSHTPVSLARHIVSAADPGLRARVCEVAGINPASDETWEMAVRMLEDRSTMVGPVTLRRVGL